MSFKDVLIITNGGEGIQTEHLPDCIKTECFEDAENILSSSEISCVIVDKKTKLEEARKFFQYLEKLNPKPAVILVQNQFESELNYNFDYILSPSNAGNIEEYIRIAKDKFKELKKGKKARNRLDAVLEYTPASVYFKNTKKKHEEVSKYFLEDMESGINSQDDIKGKTDKDLHSASLAKKTMKDEDKILSEGHTIRNKMEYSPREEIYNLTSKGPVRSEDGEIQGIYGITMNVTEKKERMLVMESLQKVASDLLRADSVHSLCSEVISCLNEIVDFDSASIYRYMDDQLNLACEAENYEEDRRSVKIDELVENVVENGENVWNREIDQSLVSCISVGNQGALVIIKQEEQVTPYRKEALSILTSNMEAAIDRNRERKEKRKLKQLGDIISHELRNPLNIAEAYLAQIEDNQNKKQISEALNRLEQIIGSMDKLAKSDETLGKIERIKLESIAKEAWQDTETVEASLLFADNMMFRGDPEKVKQIFEGLFENAIEHGGPNVEVTVGTLENGFFIQDDGKGITEGLENEIFEYNFSTSRNNAGIGLSIIQRIVRAHGWKISSNDVDEGGARFEITGL